MEPPREPDPEADLEQRGAEQSSRRLDIKAKHGKKSKYSPKNHVRWQNFVRALCSLEEWWECFFVINL
jgi:hypothetical protein